MNRESSELAAMMDELAGSAAPPSRVDVGTAIRVGRGRIRRRRVVTGATTLVVVALAGLVAQVFPAPGPGLPAAPGYGTGTPTPPPSRLTASPSGSPPSGSSQSGSFTPPYSDYTPLPPYPTPSRTTPSGPDPLVVPGTFGWLPAWAADITTTGELPVVYVSDGSEGADRRTVTLQLFPGSQTPEGYDYPGRTETDPVNGHQAYLGQIPFGSNPDRVLMWQTGSGRWASLRASQLSADERKDLPRIAASVVFKDTPTPLPAKVPKVPGDPQLASVTLTTPVNGRSGYWSFQVRYGQIHSALDLTVESMAARSTPTAGKTASAEATLPGSTCREDKGVRVCAMSTGDPGSDPLPSVDALTAWLNQVELLGQDQSNWTTQGFK
ncbi:hypothetical protein ABT095_38140 [Kitasatospora sp. NPDC002227]|uniref:hypothetical protein n=1 Tax=Kitasatospora sp. NPDC002227 TaxID=3154773 RepID=UPI00332E9110